MGVLEDIGGNLLAASLATPGVDLFYDRLPETRESGALAALFLYSSRAPRHTSGETNYYIHERPRVQIAVVAVTRAEVITLIEALYHHLAFRENVVISDMSYSFRPLQQPFYLGRDENDRIKYTFNLEVQRVRCQPIPA